MSDGWKVQIRDHWNTMTVEVIPYRHWGGKVEVGDRHGVFHTFSENEQPPDLEWYTFPRSALNALRDAIDDQLGVRPEVELVKELRTTLDVERARVDSVIAAAIGPQDPAT